MAHSFRGNAAALLSALLLGLSVPPHGTPVLAWAGLVPLLTILRRCGPAEAARRGWVTGFVFALVALPWVRGTVQRFTETSAWTGILGSIVFAAWIGAAFAMWSVVTTRWRAGVGGILWPAISWAGVMSAWPAVVPCMPLFGVSAVPAWIQGAELGGHPLVEGIVVSFASAMAYVVSEPSHSVRAFYAFVGAGLFVGNHVYGCVVLDAAERGQAEGVVHVGLVQPNFPDGEMSPVTRLETLRDAIEQARTRGAELVVLPEAGAYPYVLPRPITGAPQGYRGLWSGPDVPVVVGFASRNRETNTRYNSAALFDTGTVPTVFDKTRLFPLGESLERFEWAARILPHAQKTAPGDGPVVFTMDREMRASLRLGPLICFEDLHPDFVRDVARQPGGVDVLVALVNDSWFGHDEGPEQHAALAKFRAVESRTPLVRVVSSGPSQIYDAFGRSSLRLEQPNTPSGAEASVAVGEVAFATVPTLTRFVRWGWIFAPLCSALVAVSLLVRRRS